MKNNNLYRAVLLPAFALLCLVPAAWSQSFQISPPPLAKNAKARPDEFPEQKAKRDLDANYVRMNVLIGSRNYDALEKITQDWLAQYRAKKIDSDQYRALLNTLAPSKAGKGMLNDMLAWTQVQPKSYAAWYGLGRLYHDIAWQERGNGWAGQTTHAQVEAMGKYAHLSQEAYTRSVALTNTPVVSYDQLMRISTISPRPSAGVIGTLRSMVPRGQKRLCPAKDAADGRRNLSRFDEQLHYLCLALDSDPNAVGTYAGFVYYNSPRWGGSYPPLEKALKEIVANGRTDPLALGRMRAELLALEAEDAASDNDQHRAAELYVQAFRAAPMPEHVRWMYKAAYYERDSMKNLDRAQVLFSEIAAYRPDEYEAIAALGWIYEERGDLKKYMENMTVAAGLGMKEAQNNLGYYYMVGQRGLPRDLQQAKEWLTLAANQGFEHSREKLGLVDAMIAKEKGTVE